MKHQKRFRTISNMHRSSVLFLTTTGELIVSKSLYSYCLSIAHLTSFSLSIIFNEKSISNQTKNSFMSQDLKT